MKSLVIIFVSVLTLNSCQSELNKSEAVANTSPSMNLDTQLSNSREGTYMDNTNELRIKEIDDKTLNVELGISSQQCAMPSYTGDLNQVSDNIYEGLVSSDLTEYENDTHHLKLVFADSLIGVKSNDNWEKWQFGAACWVEGQYVKEH